MGFADKISQFAEKTNVRASVIFRKIGLSVAASLIQKSPVDTGRFRGNWMLGIGQPDSQTIEITDVDGNQSQARIANGIQNVFLGDAIYITNALPYAIPLEYGWSKQAPNGMVRLTVAEWSSHVGNAIRGVGI
jgi:hypothetical protein